MIYSHDMVKDYYSVLKEKKEVKKEVANILPPPKVRLNKHNIIDVQKTLLHTYRVNNMDEDNPYHHLEKCLDFGFLHDATSHWVKELDTVFLQVVTGEGDIYKVPFSMGKVPGSFTVEALCEELINEISVIKTQDNNATDNISNAVEEYFKDKNKDLEPVGQYRKLHEELKQAAQKAEMNKLMEIKAEMDSPLQKYPILKSLDLDESTSTDNETTATSVILASYSSSTTSNIQDSNSSRN